MQDLSLGLLFFFGFLTYTTNDEKTVLYAITLLLFFLVVALRDFRISLSGEVWLFSILYFFIVFVCVLMNFYRAGLPIQVLVYPVIFFVGSGTLWRVYLVSSPVKFFIVGLFLANAAVSFLSIGLDVASLPLLGDITRGRYIFFTSLRSSAGFLWNVNYFALCQAVGFWISYSLLNGELENKKFRLLAFSALIFLAISVFLGSSRSISVLFLSTLLFAFANRSSWFLLLLIPVIPILGFKAYEVYLQNSVFFDEALRLNRGLNSRDEIWQAALRTYEEAPFFGYASTTEVARLLLANGSPTTSLQSSYFAYLLLFGWLGLVFFLTVVLRTLVRAFHQRNSEPAALAAFCNILILLADSFSRTFMLGGIGLLPLVLVASISFFLRAKHR